MLGFGRARAAHAKDKVIDGSIAYARKAKLEIVIPDHLLNRALKKSWVAGSEAALEADGTETLVCAYLSLTLLVGLGANALWGWWWADPLAALTIVGFLVHEGREALEQSRGEDDGT